jgi:3-oxoacyl-[acyl-carrier protein] reductase
VALGDIDEAAIARTAEAITAAGGEALPLAFDLADLSAIEGRISAIEAKLGPVDVLVNNTCGPPPHRSRISAFPTRCA